MLQLIASVILSIVAIVCLYKTVEYLDKKEKSKTEPNYDFLKTTVKEVWDDLLGTTDSTIKSAAARVRTSIELESTINELQTKYSKLQVDLSRKEEEYARRDREIEHKLGLERKRQEQELNIKEQQMKVEFDKKVNELQATNIAEDKKRYNEQMKFNNERFEKQLEKQNELISQLVGDVTRKTSTRIEGSV